MLLLAAKVLVIVDNSQISKFLQNYGIAALCLVLRYQTEKRSNWDLPYFSLIY